MAKTKETRLEDLELKLNPDEDVLVTYYEGEDWVTFIFPLNMRGVKMSMEEYKQKYPDANEVRFVYVENWGDLKT